MQVQLELERFSKWLAKNNIKDCFITVRNGDIATAVCGDRDVLSEYRYELIELGKEEEKENALSDDFKLF